MKHEVKSQLAKLLATEDLVVEHRFVETAQFNVNTRVLTLPRWERASNMVYDLLVGHEVGHALFTPDQDSPKGIPHSFVNIVEDARIEKLMKRKYPGLSKTFFKGYSELSDQDFFCLEGEDISKMTLADRANLYFKIGNYVDIPFFNFDESNIVKMIADCETFADVCFAAEEMYNYDKKSKEEEQKQDVQMSAPSSEGQSGGSNESEEKKEDGEVDDSQETESKQGESESSEQLGDGEKSDNAGASAEPEVKTVDSLDESLRELISNHGGENIYVELPKVNLDTVVAKNQEVHDYIDANWSIREGDYPFQTPDSLFTQFKRSAQKEVNYLVKEFECKKAADSYARASVSRTGVLDCTKLHTYKYNDDLFRKVTTLADGKNHGLVFVLDWSGSMANVIEDTCKQLFNLIWFCKKVNIPFEVYAFTNEWIVHETLPSGAWAPLPSHYEAKEGQLVVDENFCMMNILTSKVNGKTLEHQMKNIFRIAYYFGCRGCYSYEPGRRVSLSGTPLNEAIITLHQILPKFQSENKLQKVQCVVLTDGEAGFVNRHATVTDYKGEERIGSRRLVADRTFVRDRKTGNTYQVKYRFNEFTDLLLKNLKDNFTDMNLIGIRVLNPRDASSFIKMYSGDTWSDEAVKINNTWRKEKSFVIKNSGYDAYFGMSATALNQETEFDVDEGATKAKIKSAFVKSLKTKKLNKRILGEFVSLVV
nr:peptidase [uncultured Mediterranean phage uvMED]